jgi:hypothetical protein
VKIKYLRLAPEVFSNQCPRLVKKCYFTIPFEGLDHYPRVVGFVPPRPSHSIGGRFRFRIPKEPHRTSISK